MQEVLNSLERHTVCTGTQCFEGEEDAFGITTTPNGAPSNNTTFFMFMMCARPAQLTRWLRLPGGSLPTRGPGGLAERRNQCRTLCSASSAAADSTRARLRARTPP